MKRIYTAALFLVLLLGQVAFFPPSMVSAQPEDGSPTSDPATSTEVPPPPPVIPTDSPAEIEIAAEPVVGQQAEVNTALLNVRATPSTTGTIVTKLSLGTIHTVIDGPVASGGFQWYKLDLPGDVDGWAAGLYLDAVEGGAATSTPGTSPSATTTAPSGTPRIGDIVAVNTSVLNVRSGAGTTFSIVTTVTSGAMYSVIGGPSSGSGLTWVRLDLPGPTDGWAATQYLRIVSRPSPTTTSSPTQTFTPTVTHTPTVTSTPTETHSPTNTPTETATLTGSETATFTATSTSTATNTPVSTPTVTAGTYRVGDIVAVGTALNVRSGPGTNYGVTTVVNPGTQGTVRTGNTPGGSYTWIDVQFSGVRGWVATNYVTHLALATATPPASATSIDIALNCTTNPERITITNSNSSSVTIVSIGTLYDVGSNEPFVLNQTLGGGQSRTYLAGSQATGSFRLTTSLILTDSAGTSEGVRVVTSAGTLTKNCPPASTADRWVEVDLSEQYMRVYQGTTLISGTYVSTGGIGFDTPVGTYRTWLKYTSQTMSGCIRGECYVVPNVPWVHYFTYYGHALHGAYWHNDFGTRRSHGCVNLPVPFAEWLYFWLPMNSRVVVKY